MAEEALENYRSDARRYDELLDGAGNIRPHWRTLIERLARDDADAVRRGVDMARRLIVENGVTYNVYGDTRGALRPWDLNALPFVLPA